MSNRHYQYIVDQALELAYPDFFALSEGDQERRRFALQFPKEGSEDVRAKQRAVYHILSTLLNKEISTKDQYEQELKTLDELGEPNSKEFNHMKTLLYGIGKDHLHLNETETEAAIYKYDRVGDWARVNYEYQQTERQKSLLMKVLPTEEYTKVTDADVTIPPYRGDIYFSWARMVHNDKFYYGELRSVSHHLQDIFLDYGWDYLRGVVQGTATSTTAGLHGTTGSRNS